MEGTDKKDLIRNSLIALTSTVPYIGGTISFLLDKYIPSETEKRRNEFIKKLEADLKEIEEKVDDFNLDTPEFYSIFTRLLKESMEEYRSEKITAFRNLTIHIVLKPQEFNKIDFFAKLVISLVPDEIMILHIFYMLDVEGELKMLDGDIEKRDIYEIISKVYGIEDMEYMRALITDCQRYRLIIESQQMQKRMGRKGLFLSDLGREFLTYIFSPKEGGMDGEN